MSALDLSEIGCCSLCELRFSGCRQTKLYEHPPFLDSDVQEGSKRSKFEICICCLGLLQPHLWPQMLRLVRNDLELNEYDSESFACGLSLPVNISLREHSLCLYLKQKYPDWKADSVVPFKQAWKWSFGSYMADMMKKPLDSGSVCQLLVTLHMSYAHEAEELECLKAMAPKTFNERIKCRKKYNGEVFSRSSIDGILEKMDDATFKSNFDSPPKSPDEALLCFKVEFTNDSLYIGGRYMKYSRELPQTPWVVDGKRIVENSIQEIIFKPIINFYGIPIEMAENRCKFISSGREDVDVRCLGNGRPFVVEIINPKITKISDEKLKEMESEMSDNELLSVIRLQTVEKDALKKIKEGENSKSKTYTALCVKLSDNLILPKLNKKNENVDNGKSVFDNSIEMFPVTESDIKTINNYNNVPGTSEILIKQKTPLRVLHRRPLLTRSRKILNMKASLVDGRPNLFTVEVTTEAGTYIKEFVHGDFGRTAPNLCEILGFKVDILALDVNSVNLEWP